MGNSFVDINDALGILKNAQSNQARQRQLDLQQAGVDLRMSQQGFKIDGNRIVRDVAEHDRRFQEKLSQNADVIRQKLNIQQEFQNEAQDKEIQRRENSLRSLMDLNKVPVPQDIAPTGNIDPTPLPGLDQTQSIDVPQARVAPTESQAPTAPPTAQELSEDAFDDFLDRTQPQNLEDLVKGLQDFQKDVPAAAEESQPIPIPTETPSAPAAVPSQEPDATPVPQFSLTDEQIRAAARNPAIFDELMQRGLQTNTEREAEALRLSQIRQKQKFINDADLRESVSDAQQKAVRSIIQKLDPQLFDEVIAPFGDQNINPEVLNDVFEQALKNKRAQQQGAVKAEGINQKQTSLLNTYTKLATQEGLPTDLFDAATPPSLIEAAIKNILPKSEKSDGVSEAARNRFNKDVLKVTETFRDLSELQTIYNQIIKKKDDTFNDVTIPTHVRAKFKEFKDISNIDSNDDNFKLLQKKLVGLNDVYQNSVKNIMARQKASPDFASRIEELKKSRIIQIKKAK